MPHFLRIGVEACATDFDAMSNATGQSPALDDGLIYPGTLLMMTLHAVLGLHGSRARLARYPMTTAAMNVESTGDGTKPPVSINYLYHLWAQ